VRGATGIYPLSNRHDVVRECVDIWTALVKDVQYSYPDLADDLERDLLRIRDLAVNRGIHLFTVDMPALAKHLDRCLAVGEYLPSKLPLSRAVSAGVVIPKFLRGLYLLIFDSSTGLLKNDDIIGPVRTLRQLLSMLKKLDMQCSPEKIANTISDFYDDDLALPEPPLYWEGDGCVNAELAATVGSFSDLASSGALTLDNRRTKILDLIAGIVCSELGSYNPDSWRHRHGPGAISQSTKKGNKYHWYHWSDRLDSEFPISESGFYNHSSWAAGNWKVGEISTPIEWEDCEAFSRLIAVPKTFKAPRLIAAEPSENMWCQQNIWNYLCERTHATMLGNFIQFKDQSQNQSMCLRGATDGSLATVDLSAASDRVSCDVVGAVFRSNPRLLAALRATRTRQVKMPDKSIHRLRKFSTMGSACTFPVQSLIFTIVALAARFIVSGEKVNSKTISELKGSITVFGDDIIVPQTDLEELRSLLVALRFKVNESKTYGTGMFRESCGVDAFRGIEVTPVYMRTFDRKSPEGLVSSVASHNSFRKAGYVTVAKYLARLLHGRIDRVVAGSTVFGLDSSPDQLHILGRKLKWNDDLQRVEIRHRSPRAKVDRVPSNDDAGIFQFFTERPSSLIDWSHGFDQRPVGSIRPTYYPLTEVCGMT
jgi:hypothetical protein